MSQTEKVINEKYGFDTDAIRAYAGRFREDALIKASSSGGAASALAECVIADGGVVFGAVYTEDFKGACFASARRVEELSPMKTSKYIMTDKRLRKLGAWVSVFDEVGSCLSAGEEVLFTGLPCDVGALLVYLDRQRINTEKLYTVDLICHGPTYPEVQRDYINTLEQKYGAPVKEFSVRDKSKGWTPPMIRAVFENGKVHKERFYESEFGYAFKLYSRVSCFSCMFKGDDHRADLTVGDFWGLKEGMAQYHKLGVSILFSRSEKGEALMKKLSAREDFLVEDADKTLALDHNRSLYRLRTKPEQEYEKFKNDFEEHGLSYAVKNHPGYRAHKKRITRRRIKGLIPKPVLKGLRKLKGR